MLAPIVQKKRLWQVDVPPETLDQWNEKLKFERQKWGKYFSDPYQCDLFSMLPVNDKQRTWILTNMIKASKLRDEVRACHGEKNTSKEHREQCLDCVAKFRPAIAKPFYS